jgi:hypothetical protein
MDKNPSGNLKEESTWLRLVFIILFAILFNLAEVVLTAVVVVQFLSTLVRGKPVSQITVFGQNLSTFVYEMLLFLTFRTDDMPWPISAWPSGPPSDAAGETADGSESTAPTGVADAPDEGAPAKPKPRPAKKPAPKKKPKPKT